MRRDMLVPFQELKLHSRQLERCQAAGDLLRRVLRAQFTIRKLRAMLTTAASAQSGAKALAGACSRVCVCVCVCACGILCVCVCVCVCVLSMAASVRVSWGGCSLRRVATVGWRVLLPDLRALVLFTPPSACCTALGCWFRVLRCRWGRRQ